MAKNRYHGFPKASIVFVGGSGNRKQHMFKVILLAVTITALCQTTALAQATQHNSHGVASSAAAAPDLVHLKARVQAEPSDAKVRYAYAEGLRKLGRNKEASHEYLAVTELDPAFYHAYHQLSVISSDKQLLDDAISRLNFAKAEKPKDLFLRVALSELYEKKGDSYTAGKVLVELVYDNGVPEKFAAKVNQRIRFLQAKSKHGQSLDKAFVNDDTMETNPPPLPEGTLNRDLSISKVKEPRVMQGFGHATLLP